MKREAVAYPYFPIARRYREFRRPMYRFDFPDENLCGLYPFLDSLTIAYNKLPLIERPSILNSLCIFEAPKEYHGVSLSLTFSLLHNIIQTISRSISKPWHALQVTSLVFVHKAVLSLKVKRKDHRHNGI